MSSNTALNQTAFAVIEKKTTLYSGCNFIMKS